MSVKRSSRRLPFRSTTRLRGRPVEIDAETGSWRRRFRRRLNYGEQNLRGAGRLEHDGGVLIVRATKKIAERLGGFATVPAAPDRPQLGEWYATAMFWRPQVALFVSETTLLPVFVPLAPANTVVRRLPAELADVLRRQGVPDEFIDAELAKMSASICPAQRESQHDGRRQRIRPPRQARNARRRGKPDLTRLSDWLAQTPMGPLRDRRWVPQS